MNRCVIGPRAQVRCRPREEIVCAPYSSCVLLSTFELVQRRGRPCAADSTLSFFLTTTLDNRTNMSADAGDVQMCVRLASS